MRYRPAKPLFRPSKSVDELENLVIHSRSCTPSYSIFIFPFQLDATWYDDVKEK